MEIRQEIRLLAESMEIGQTLRIICPVCRGGSTNERSLTITLFEGLLVKYNCFRSGCGGLVAGHVTLTSAPLRQKTLNTHPIKTFNFDGSTMKLTSHAEEWILKTWGIVNPPYWYWTATFGGRIAMSVRTPRYTHRGWVLRDISGKAKSKALTYIEEKETPLCWYKRPYTHSPAMATVLVEDIPSAVRASKFVTHAVALLGVGVGVDRAEEIAKSGPTPVIIALDQDATSDAFAIQEKWGLLWKHTRVLPLKQDIKDMSDDDLEVLFK